MEKSTLTKSLLAVLLLVIGYTLHWQTCQTQQYSSALSQYFNSSVPVSANKIWNIESRQNNDEANYIIQKSFQSSYAHILPCVDKRDVPAKECLKNIKEQLDSMNHTDTPWWFHTLLRDLPNNGAFGFWHQFSTPHPPIRFCTIEKVGTTEWRKVFCKLNKEECEDPELKKQCNRQNCMWNTKRKMPANPPRVVFLRDPLERFLSAYLDKCEKPRIRMMEKHCEPNLIFNPEPNQVDEKGREIKPLTYDLDEKKKQKFGAYVDVMPLKWNLHFNPQAISCDLFRELEHYDFVGNMGKDFMVDLNRMASQFGDPLAKILNDQFEYEKMLQDEDKQHNNTGSSKKHATHAPAKVMEFYTARTVRKVLEYVSIDYVVLGLEVPEWAVQMLKEDE